MTLYQAALKTYESAEKAGLTALFDTTTKTVLAPVCHNTTGATIRITLTSEGKFVAIERLEKENQRVVIPVTEDSAKRTSGIAAHPLCEGVDYLLPDDEEKHSEYMKGLRAWAESEYSHPSVRAVLRYMEEGTLAEDLKQVEIKEEEQKKPSKKEEKKRKDFVCWSIGSFGNTSEDKDLMKCWQDYVTNVLKAGSPVGLDMLTGKETVLAEDHLKGVLPIEANAKFISFQDTANSDMRYLGRFRKKEDVLTIGFETSQKMHNALKWVMSRFGVYAGLDSCVAACWSPEALDPPAKIETSLRPFSDESVSGPEGYRDELEKLVAGYKASVPADENVCMVILSAPTQGRISVPLFVQFSGSDFMENLKDWDLWCCWPGAKNQIWAPSLPRIADFALGIPREDSKTHEFKPVADKKLKAKAFIALAQARISGGRIPDTIVRCLVRNCEKMRTYIGPKNDTFTLRDLLWITCAVIRKYRKDRFGEEVRMGLEKEKKDRSYQFGRLLAIMEKIEKDACPKDKQPKITNAIKMQTVFARRPAYAEQVVMEKLKRGYWKKLSEGQQAYYSKLITEIHGVISEFGDDEYGKPLTEMYLPGYYLQQKELYTKKEDKTSEGDEE